jgi:hypothetical protein
VNQIEKVVRADLNWLRSHNLFFNILSLLYIEINNDIQRRIFKQ